MKTKDPETELPFPSDKFKLIWAEWLTYRRERKLPKYTPTGLKRTMNGLLRDSQNNEDNAIRIIINSLEKSWQGLFPIHNNGTNNQRNFAGTKPEAGVIAEGSRGQL